MVGLVSGICLGLAFAGLLSYVYDEARARLAVATAIVLAVAAVPPIFGFGTRADDLLYVAGFLPTLAIGFGFCLWLASYLKKRWS